MTDVQVSATEYTVSAVPEGNITRPDPPLRIFLYRGWCWICHVCNPTPGTRQAAMRRPSDSSGVGWGYPTRERAMDAAMKHCNRPG